jgi:uncharacterized protein (DUF885 family)
VRPNRRQVLVALPALAAAPAAFAAPDDPVQRMVARGKAREEALRRAFPSGKPDGSSPYVLSQRHGAWTELGAPKPGLAERLDEETRRLRSDFAPPAFILAEVVRAQRQAKGLPPDIAAASARQVAALEALRPAPGAGVWRVPGGEAYYAARLRCTSGTDLSPLALDRRVAAESKALLARADGLLKRLGLPRGSVGERLRALKARHPYPNDEGGRARAIADMNGALDRLRPHLAAWFAPPLPAASVRRMSPAGKRGYREAPYYFPDLAAVHERPAWTLTTVAFHETIPGHLLQLARRPSPDPLQLRYAPGFSEGWAIYAETLADRIGILSPEEQLGFLQSLLFRLARVRADIGLHVRRWTRDQAIAFLAETLGFELFFAFDVEVDRYCVEPAAFAGDAVVALELMRLARGLTPAAARRFHEAALARGPLSAEALPTLL